MSKKRKKLRGTVNKIIKPAVSAGSEKAEIGIHEADALYREIRVDNVMTDDEGNEESLKQGDEVDVTLEAEKDGNKSGEEE